MSLVVCPVGELPPWQMRTVMADGVALVVAHAPEGSYHAVRGVCAHQGGMLGEGTLSHLIYEYDVVTGRCLTDPKLRLRTYPVRIEAGNLVVDV